MRKLAGPATIALFALALAASATSASAPRAGTPANLERGRRLVVFGACNECHTPGWHASGGTLPAARWMTGSPIGFRGPWGTAYPANVRQRFSVIDEEQWLGMVRTRGGHPPMTWDDVRAISVADQRAIYRFIRSLGSAGEPSRPSLPPGRVPTTPYYDVAPLMPS